MYSEIHPPTRIARVDPRVEAHRDHPQRRAELGVRRERSRQPTRRCSTSPRCSASATACSSSRTCSAARSTRGGRREYGRAEIRPTVTSALFEGFDRGRERDRVDEPRRPHRVAAAGFPCDGGERGESDSPRSSTRTRPIYGVQFHPEVAHTPRGGELIANFLFDVCGATPSWTPGAFIEDEVAKIRAARRRRAGDLRAIGRRRLFRRRRARAPRDRRPAHVRLRRHGPAAPARARAGRAHDAHAPGHQARHGRRGEPLPRARSRGSTIPRRSGAPSGTRSSTSSRKRRRAPEPTRSSWCRERCIPT